MFDLATALFFAAVIAYSVAATLYFVIVARGQELTFLRSGAKGVMGLAVFLQLASIIQTSGISKTCPVMSLPFALNFVTWSLACIFFLLATRFSWEPAGIAIAPLSLFGLVFAQVIGVGTQVGAPKPLLAFHIAANVMGCTLFLLAGAAALLYLFEERRLRRKLPKGLLLGKLPPLGVLDLSQHRLLLLAFPLLSFGVVSGSLFLSDADHLMLWDYLRLLMALITWGLLVSVMLARVIGRWKGRRAAMGAVSGAAGVLLVLLGYTLRAGGLF